MVEEEVTAQNIPPATLKACRHCFEDIKPEAKVCHHCSRLQAGFWRLTNVIRIPEVMSILLSAGLLVVAFSNFFSTQQQLSKAQEALTQANQAIAKAESALVKATATEGRVLAAQGQVWDVAQALNEIAEILSHTSEVMGGGLTEQNRALLKNKLDRLTAKLGKAAQR